jgi:hypothetical protein
MRGQTFWSGAQHFAPNFFFQVDAVELVCIVGLYGKVQTLIEVHHSTESERHWFP